MLLTVVTGALATSVYDLPFWLAVIAIGQTFKPAWLFEGPAARESGPLLTCRRPALYVQVPDWGHVALDFAPRVRSLLEATAVGLTETA
jgi:hypothetical protein